MKMILGLLKADAGDIFVGGEKVTYGNTKTNRHIGYLPDVPEFYDYMTPKEYLLLCGEITGLTKKEILEKSQELLKLVGLEKENHRIKNFSRGMKQRLGIAQALLNGPKLLICDEPTSALDPVGRKEVLDILANIKNQTTVIFSTHVLSDVERICDEVAMLHQGKIVLQGSLEDVKARYATGGFLIKFSNEVEIKKFLAHPFWQNFTGEIQQKELTLTIKENEEENLGQKILVIFQEENILPSIFEKQLPSLEGIFQKVVEK